MSEELTRFPIQPDDVRRTAKSSDDIKTVDEELGEIEREQETPDADKPRVPPHERHDRDWRDGRDD